MLTSALRLCVFVCAVLAFGAGLTPSNAVAEEQVKVIALGLADHAVGEEEVANGSTLPAPRFNSAGVAHVLVTNLKKGDTVEVTLAMDGVSLMHNTETLSEDKPRFLLQAGKTGVPAGGWPQGKYQAGVKVTRDGKTVLEEKSKAIPFD
jgi:hypothetical protein